MKRINQTTVLKCVWVDQKISKAQLAEKLGLSYVTVSQLADEWIEQKMLRFKEIGDSTGGRKPQLLEINTESSYLLGVSLGKKYIEFGIMSLYGDMHYYDKIKIHSDNFFDHLMVIEDKCYEYSGLLENKKRKIAGVGLVIDGSICHDTQFVYELDYFRNKNFSFESDPGMNLVVAENTFAYLLGERYFGSALHSKSMAYLNIDDRVKVSLCVNGKAYTGHNLKTCNIEHFKLSSESTRCTCGKSGCFSGLVTNIGIVHRFLEAVKQGADSQLIRDYKTEIDKDAHEGEGFVTRELIYEYANRGDALALKVVKETGTYIGRGVAQIVNLVNPERIFISGIYSASNVMNSEINRALNKNCYHTNLNKVYVGSPRIINNKNVLAAGALALDRLLNNEFSK